MDKVRTEECAKKWGEILPGSRESSRHVGKRVQKRHSKLPRVEGPALWRLREEHEGEHRGLMKFVDKPLYLRRAAKVRGIPMCVWETEGEAVEYSECEDGDSYTCVAVEGIADGGE